VRILLSKKAFVKSARICNIPVIACETQISSRNQSPAGSGTGAPEFDAQEIETARI
jgi:hypothetical protein